MTVRPCTWHEIYDNVIGLGSWLENEVCYFSDTTRMLEYFEKPWKWTREYELYCAWSETHKDEETLRECLIEAVSDDKQTRDRFEYFRVTPDVTEDPASARYRGAYVIQREHNIGPGKWSWAHEDYDGPGDSRCGVAESAGQAIRDIQALCDWI